MPGSKVSSGMKKANTMQRPVRVTAQDSL